MRGVAQAEGDRIVVQPLKAVRVELQADLAPHVCSIDVLALPARQGPALPQDEVVSILCMHKLRSSFLQLHHLCNIVCQSQYSPPPSYACDSDLIKMFSRMESADRNHRQGGHARVCSYP